MQELLNVFRLRRNRRFAPEVAQLSDWKISFDPFQQPTVVAKDLPQMRKEVSEKLFLMIDEAKVPCFLLPAVIDFISKVSQGRFFYHFTHFEQWLIIESGLDEEQELLIRAKIMGKWAPREDYQFYFPIGGQRFFPGCHYILSHPNPDLDTFIASFWGFVDAFATKVGLGCHIWNVPAIFSHIQPLADIISFAFPEGFLPLLAHSRPSLEPLAEDLVDRVNDRDPSIPGYTAIAHIKGDTAIESRYGFLKERLDAPLLGTVSLRDFGNQNEMALSDRLQIISIIDHHRIHIKVSEPPVMQVADVQSCNVLLAEIAFQINDRIRSYSADYFVDSNREIAEYLTFLYAICDDTDCLSKVTARDTECARQLINRLQSLIQGRDREPISFAKIPRDAHFSKASANQLLQNDDFIAIMDRITLTKSQGVETQIQVALMGNSGPLFSDTKIQNHGCSVGQIKLFSWNMPSFQNKQREVMQLFIERSNKAYAQNPSCYFYLQMISTVKTNSEPLKHEDSFWIWVPDDEKGIGQLTSFISSFSKGIDVKAIGLKAHLFDPIQNRDVEIPLETIIHSHRSGLLPNRFSERKRGPEIQDERRGQGEAQEFAAAASSEGGEGGRLGRKEAPLIVFTFQAGALNSRKAKVTPHL